MSSQLRHYLDFLWAMTEKEIKARYKRAVFGFLWVVLNPVLQMLIIGFIFSFFIKIPNYFLFLFTGLLPWQFFSLSLSKATPSFVYERALLQKAKFPVEAIPVSIILSNFVNLVISLILLLIYLALIRSVLFPQILLMVPAAFWLLLITIGTSLITSSLNVKYRDIGFFVRTLLTLWFYATPVLYSLEIIPLKLRQLFTLNPLTTIFELLHYSILGQGVLNRQLLVFNLISTLIIILVGVSVFRKESKYFVDWI